MPGKRSVDAEEAKEYAKENNIIYMDTSAKTGLNVKEIFVAIGACGADRRVWMQSAVAALVYYFLLQLIPCHPLLCLAAAAKKLPKNIRPRDADIITDLKVEPEDRAATSSGCCGSAAPKRNAQT